MKTETRQKIIEAGARIIHHKGYHHTGIQEILKAAGVPKGSFYFYFENKEDFGLQVIDHFNGYYLALADECLQDTALPPLNRIDRFLGGFADLFESVDFTLGCPIGNLAQEMGDLSAAFRRKLQRSVRAMVDLYVRVLAEAQQKGDLADGIDIRETADFIVSSWHGALVRMKIEKGRQPLDSHRRFVMQTLLTG